MGVRHIPNAASFVYVMRRDSEYVARQFVRRLGADAALADVTAAYERAVDALAKAVLRAFSVVHEHPAVDLLDAAVVHERRLELIERLCGVVVSMDPLMDVGTLPLAFSRCYQPGGANFIGMIPRPGYPSLEDQVARIAAAAEGGSLVVVEDDFFTGDTLMTMLGTHLGSLTEKIAGVVAGTKIGLKEPDFPIYPAVRYRRQDGKDPLEKVDLGDPRDFVLGASGLVCRLASGRLGRLPYVLPFVSPAERASIPKAAEIAFSREALELSRTFYDDLDAILGFPVVLANTDPAFVLACEELLGTAGSTPMAEVLSSIEDRGAELVA